MRIGVVTSSYPQYEGDPAGHFVRSEVQQLLDAGHQVWVFCPGPSGAYPLQNTRERIVGLGGAKLFGWPGALVKLRKAPWRALTLPAFIWNARRVLHAQPPDRWIAHWLIPCAWPMCVPLSHDKPQITLEVVVHGSDARLLRRFPRLLRARILQTLYKSGATLRFVAPHLARELFTAGLEEWLGTGVVAPSPLGIDLGKLPDFWLDRATARRDLDVPTDAFLAIVISRLIPQKNVHQALTEAPLPADAMRVVIGSGPLEQRLRKEFPNVRFTGQLSRERALRWLASADVLLNASRVEGLPTVVREARALDVEVWTAPFEGAHDWAARDSGIRLMF